MTRIQERILADPLALIRVNPPEIRVIRVQFLYAVALWKRPGALERLVGYGILVSEER